jgi:relaxase-like protein
VPAVAVIPAVTKGKDVVGLLRYLFGPGKREEHTNAHLVAVWNGGGSVNELEPPILGDGGRDIRRLADLLNQPVLAALRKPKEPVWHCSIRTHPTDRVLSDRQWGHIAGEVMAAVGLAPHGDDRAVRWVAVRHADAQGEDHIHLVATLVRQDRRRAWTNYDYAKAQQACRDLEERYDLYRVAPPGKGSRTWPSPDELNKTSRLHRASTSLPTTGRSRRRPVAPRERLRRQVRAAAATATDEADFFRELRRAGVKVKLRRSQRNPDEVTGYAVGLDGHTNRSGETILYGGGKLAADLSLPRLRVRWRGMLPAEPGSPQEQVRMYISPGIAYARAQRVTEEAAAALRATTDPAQAAGIARAAADLLTAIAKRWEGRDGGPLTEAAELFDRAAYDQRVAAAHDNLHATRLRGMARLILLTASLSREEDVSNTTRLLLTLALFLIAWAEMREARRLVHQAQAAREAAQRLRSWTPPPAATAATGPAAPLPERYRTPRPAAIPRRR